MFAPVRCCFDVMFLFFALLFALTVVGLRPRSHWKAIIPQCSVLVRQVALKGYQIHGGRLQTYLTRLEMTITQWKQKKQVVNKAYNCKVYIRTLFSL